MTSLAATVANDNCTSLHNNYLLFCKSLKAHLVTNNEATNSILLFAGNPLSECLETLADNSAILAASSITTKVLAERYNTDSVTVEKIVNYVEETCLPSLLCLYERYSRRLDHNKDHKFAITEALSSWRELSKWNTVQTSNDEVGRGQKERENKDEFQSSCGDENKSLHEDVSRNAIENKDRNGYENENGNKDVVEEDTEGGDKLSSEGEESMSLTTTSVAHSAYNNIGSANSQQEHFGESDSREVGRDDLTEEESTNPVEPVSTKSNSEACLSPYLEHPPRQQLKQKRNKLRDDAASFKCSMCGQEFRQVSRLTTHVRRKHKGKLKNLCQHCGKFFESPTECHKHSKSHLVEERKSRRNQKSIERDNKSIKCHLCGVKFSFLGKLQRHIVRKHQEDMDSICLYCGEHFTDPVNHHSHIRSHLLKGSTGASRSQVKTQTRLKVKRYGEYCCGKCGMSFARRDGLQKHIIACHSEVKGQMCGLCGGVFDTLEECRVHVHTHYPDRQTTQTIDISEQTEDTKPLQHDDDKVDDDDDEDKPSRITELEPVREVNPELFCHLCNRRFYTLCSLQRHILRNHHDKKDQLCRYCGKFFNKVQDCSRHVQDHIAKNRSRRQLVKQPVGLVDGKFSCQLCGRTFRLAATLRCHRIRAHPLEKERLCPRCGKYFDTESACAKHRRLHVDKKNQRKNKARSITNMVTGPKHIKCNLCGETFYVRGEIGNHIQRKHSADRHRLCRYCGKDFGTREECRTHVRLHVIERRQARESILGRVKKSLSSQSVSTVGGESPSGHKVDVEESKAVKCQACGREYKLVSSFRRHISQYHADIQDLLCHHCGLLCEHAQACKSHLHREHNTPRQHSEEQNTLRQHSEEHSTLRQLNEEHNTSISENAVIHTQQPSTQTLSLNSGVPEGYIKCGLCPSILGSRSSMRDHIKSIHSKVQDQMCACCGRHFEDPAKLLEHQQSANTNKHSTATTKLSEFINKQDTNSEKLSTTIDKQCVNYEKLSDNADKMTGNNDEVKKVSTKESIPPGYIKCSLCSSVLGSRKSMRDHIRSLHFKDKDHMCTCCGTYFHETAERDEHMRPRANLACEFCPRVFKTVVARDSHMKRHANQRDFQCDICGNCYFDRKGLNAHRERHEAQAKGMFQCSQCDRALSSRKNLDIHMRIHNNERPFICEICGKGFTLVSTMKIHRNIHSGVKPYECGTCGKKARTKGDLGRHMSLHSDKKQFVCHVCGKAYRFQTGLNQHKAVHTGLRPYVCNMCGCTYKTSNDLHKHTKTHKPGAKTKGTTVPRVPLPTTASPPHHIDTSQVYPNTSAHSISLSHAPSNTIPPRETIPASLDGHMTTTHVTQHQGALPHGRGNNSSYSNDDMAVVMALQVLDDISVVEPGGFGSAQQSVRRYEPAQVANYPHTHTLRRYDGSGESFHGPSGFRRFDETSQSYQH